MSEEDWYRNTEWNDEIAAAFETKFKRARSQKWQYMRIQASFLRKNYPDVALQLFSRIIAGADPEVDDFEIASAMTSSAGTLLQMDDTDAILAMMEQALDFEAKSPHVITNVALDYPFMVALLEKQDLYDRALALVGDFEGSSVPVVDFGRATPLAVILASRGETEDAKKWARRALEAAATTEEPYPALPGSGLVVKAKHDIFDRLAAIAGLSKTDETQQ